MMVGLPLPSSLYYHRSRRRHTNVLQGLTLSMMLFILMMLPRGSSTEDVGLAVLDEVPQESSPLLRFARTSKNDTSPLLLNPSHNPIPVQSYQKKDAHFAELQADAISEDSEFRSGRNSQTKVYTGIPEDPPFHGKKCDSNKSCYQLFGKSLECKDGTCQCMEWKGIKLKWTDKGNICLGAEGHPCVTKTMCHSEKCEKGHCVSGGHRRIDGSKNKSLLKEIVIHISVIIVARFVLRNGV